MKDYLLLAEVKKGDYETLDYTNKRNLREAEKYFKGKWDYLAKPRRQGKIIIVRISKLVKWY